MYPDYPNYTAPYQRELPVYNAPKWDESAVDSLAQKRAAPGLRALRNEVQRVSSRSYGSPQATRLTLRAALEGYGSGLEKTLGAASTTAASEYATEYATKSSNAKATYESEVTSASAYNKLAEDTAKTDYAGKLDEWKANTAIEADTETAATAAETAAAAAKTRYDTEQSSLDSAWARYKKQKEEQAKNPTKAWSTGYTQ